MLGEYQMGPSGTRASFYLIARAMVLTGCFAPLLLGNTAGCGFQNSGVTMKQSSSASLVDQAGDSSPSNPKPNPTSTATPAPKPTVTSTPSPKPSVTPAPTVSVPVDGSDEIIGYGKGTTGGAGGKTVVVSTLSALKNAAGSADPLIIHVSGMITGTGLIDVQSNKTILGLKGSSLEGVGLMIYGKSNVIVRNMTIRKVVTYTNIIIKEGSHHVWIDHNELSGELLPGRDWSYYDGLLDIGNRSDFVTVSWNKLHDNHIPLLIGFGDANKDDAGKLNVTVHHNFFYNVTERQPCTRYGYIHVFNNYMLGGGNPLNVNTYSLGATVKATVRVENNYFEKIDHPIRTDFNSEPGFVSGLETNVFKSSGSNVITTPASNWVPIYEYKSVLHPALEVPSVVMSGSGPQF